MTLTFLTPLQTPLEGGRVFCFTTLAGGDSREGRSRIGNDLIFNLLPSPAVRVNAEMAKRTGLLGAVVQDQTTGQWEIRWGKLVQADGGALFLDGVQGFPEESMSQLREFLSERKAEIYKAASALRNARVRIVMAGNSPQPAGLYFTRLQAVRNTGTQDKIIFSERPDWLRVHIPLCFVEGDVSYNDRNLSLIGSEKIVRTIPADVFKKLVMDIWRRTLDDFVLDPPVKSRAVLLIEEWQKEYPKIDLAVLKGEALLIILHLCYAVASLKYRVNEQDKILVTVEDLDFVRELLEFYFTRHGLEKEAKNEQWLDTTAKKISDITDPVWGTITHEQAKAYETFSLAMVALYETGGRMKAEELCARCGITRRPFFQRKAITEDLITERFGKVPEIFESATGLGIKLSQFGMRIAKCIYQRPRL